MPPEETYDGYLQLENGVGMIRLMPFSYTHLRHIREKIEINPKEPRYLKVVWGVGYKIEKQ